MIDEWRVKMVKEWYLVRVRSLGMRAGEVRHDGLRRTSEWEEARSEIQ